MKMKSAIFFECKVRYVTNTDKGMSNISETVVVPANSFSAAEMMVKLEYEKRIGYNPFQITAIKIAPYKEVVFLDTDITADKFYKVRCNFISINKKNGKEKKAAVYYLVQASSVEDARKRIDEAMSDTMIDYVIVSVVETAIMDMFEHETT